MGGAKSNVCWPSLTLNNQAGARLTMREKKVFEIDGFSRGHFKVRIVVTNLPTNNSTETIFSVTYLCMGLLGPGKVIWGERTHLCQFLYAANYYYSTQ